MGLEIIRNEETGQIAPVIRCDSIRVPTCGMTVGPLGWIVVQTVPDKWNDGDKTTIYAACDEACFESVLKTWGDEEETWEYCPAHQFMYVMLTNADMVEDGQRKEGLTALPFQTLPDEVRIDVQARTARQGTVPGIAQIIPVNESQEELTAEYWRQEQEGTPLGFNSVVMIPGEGPKRVAHCTKAQLLKAAEVREETGQRLIDGDQD